MQNNRQTDINEIKIAKWSAVEELDQKHDYFRSKRSI